MKKLSIPLVASLGLFVPPSYADAFFGVGFYNTEVDFRSTDVTPRSVGIKLNKDISKMLALEGLLLTSLADDKDNDDTVNIDHAFSLNLVLNGAFSDTNTAYAYIGFAGAKISIDRSVGTNESADGSSISFGLGLRSNLNDQISLDIGYHRLFDDNIDFNSGDTDVEISGFSAGVNFGF